jgi:hypothetical protein
MPPCGDLVFLLPLPSRSHSAHSHSANAYFWLPVKLPVLFPKAPFDFIWVLSAYIIVALCLFIYA